MKAFSSRLDLPDEPATAALAQRLAAVLRPGDVVALAGTLGMGKTVFARAFIRARLGAEEEVPSPTFTLVQTYDDPDGWTLFHFDLYRLTDPEEAWELDIEDAFADGVSLIEWPDRLGTLLPASALTVTLQGGATDAGRRAEVTGTAPWKTRLAEVLP
ncbi:MAG: tRNA (adenosine(37)-N6)-threonylcarbamoyltransferase complex ATPase subunit type 1 TsaE [Magnetospiraceae bacterium]